MDYLGRKIDNITYVHDSLDRDIEYTNNINSDIIKRSLENYNNWLPKNLDTSNTEKMIFIKDYFNNLFNPLDLNLNLDLKIADLAKANLTNEMNEKLSSVLNKSHRYYEIVNHDFVSSLGFKSVIDFLEQNNPLLNSNIKYLNIIWQHNDFHRYSNVYYNTHGLTTVPVLDKRPNIPLSNITQSILNDVMNMSWEASEAFLVSLTEAVATTQGTGCIGNGIVTGTVVGLLTVKSLITNLAVLETHYQLLHAFWLDRIHDLGSYKITIDAWSNNEITILKELKPSFQSQLEYLLRERLYVHNQFANMTNYVNANGLKIHPLLDEYNDTGPISTVLDRITRVGIGEEIRSNYYPAGRPFSYTQYMKTRLSIIPGECIRAFKEMPYDKDLFRVK
jgi:hypothetical protein